MVYLVTPLRDGMNLVAGEYVAAQLDDNLGVLVLSKFSGTAEEMEEALLVNPLDIQDVTFAIRRAMTMPQQERIEQHGALLKRIRNSDETAWRQEFLTALSASGKRVA